MNPSVATSNARSRPTVDDLLRDYPPDPKLRAPRRPGETLYVANRREQETTAIEAATLDFARSPYVSELRRWRTQARERMLAAAVDWSRSYRDGLPGVPDHATLLLSGHQPEFFHPGVWFKNFVLSEEARTSAASVVPINVVIDYDLCTKRSVVHPALTASGVRQESLDIDRPALPLPYESAPIVDRSFLGSFPARLNAFRESNWADRDEPIARALFCEAGDLIESAESFGQFVARARHRYERTLGLSTLEVPFSHIAEESSFREFTALLLQNAESFRDLYNASLSAVRQVQRLRSKTHPAPNLTERDGWIEAPFWIWTKEDPRRRRLFIRGTSGGEIELSDLAGERHPFDAFDDLAEGAERLDALSRRGLAIRPRALAATIWMRMILGDAFIHGIGGAKYDQAADLLISSWFGVRPPAYLIATATFNLTDRMPEPLQRRLHETMLLLRDLTQHPERHVEEAIAPNMKPALEQVEAALARVSSSGISADLHEALSAAREEMRRGLRQRIEKTRQDFAGLERELRDARTLDSRERSFVLFDAERLPPRLRLVAERAVAQRKRKVDPAAESVRMG